MWVDVTAPGILPLGLVALGQDGGQGVGLLGASLAHAIVELSVCSRPGLLVTGGRAPLAQAQAARFYEYHRLEPQAEVQIELAIPVALGLESEPMLGLSIAYALAALHGLPTDDPPALARAVGLGPEHALAVWGFAGGGLLVAETSRVGPLQPPVARRVLAHKDRDTWAFVMFHPLAPEGTPPTLEQDRLATLLQAAQHLDPDSGRLVEGEMWPAVEADDIGRFGRALMALQALNGRALGQAGAPVVYSPTDQSILDLFQANGAFAWGRSPLGLALFGLVQGQVAAAEMKKKLLALMGHYAGTTMSTAIDSTGVRHKSREAEPGFEGRAIG